MEAKVEARAEARAEVRVDERAFAQRAACWAGVDAWHAASAAAAPVCTTCAAVSLVFGVRGPFISSVVGAVLMPRDLGFRNVNKMLFAARGSRCNHNSQVVIMIVDS